MSNIRVDLNHAPFDGEAVTFKAPCDASSITGMVIYWANGGSTVSQAYTLTDANGADIGVLDNIFAKDAIVKAILDTDGNKAYIQNPNTNTYLEDKFDGKADASHNHSASNITSGTLGVARGGTGATTFTSGAALIGAGTGAVTTRAITNNANTTTAITGSTNLVTMNTLRYAMNRTTGLGSADTNYGTSMVRGISAGTEDLTAGTSSLTSGAIYFVYE